MTEYQPRREVRFAVVMYGGVSLAIYINGVVQELFRLVRATAPNADLDAVAVPDASLTPLERIYREIGRRRQSEEEWFSGDLDLEGNSIGISSRFVIDIVSGTSAGGINGVLLAKALANGLPSIDPLRKLWIEEAAIGDLLNERKAYQGLASGPGYVSPPKSLLAGDRLLEKARTALGEMNRDDAGSKPRYVDELDLAVTMTDLQGVWSPIRLSDKSVWEQKHRASLRFVFAREEASGEGRNDLAANDRLLAFAARATSAFPFAFAPITLEEACPDPSEAEKRFFGEWRSNHAEFERFAFADGGYLQNRPFLQAIEALNRRRANTPVDRKLIYVEPDPQAVPRVDRQPALPAPDALANSQAAIVGLPRIQPIRDAIEQVRTRNDVIDRVNKATREVTSYALSPAAPPEPSPEAFDVYLRMRRIDVVDALTDVVVRATEMRESGDQHVVLKLLLDAYIGEGTVNAGFIDQLDLPFRLRRLGYLTERIDILLEGGPRAAAIRRSAGLPEFGYDTFDDAPWLRARKRELNDRFVALRAAGRSTRSRRLSSADPEGADEVAAAAQDLVSICSGEWKHEVIAAPVPEAVSADLLSSNEVEEAVSHFVAAVVDNLVGAFADDDDGPAVGRDAPAIGVILQRTFERAELIDMAVMPLRWPGLGEARRVAIHRFSPRDAEELVASPALDEHGRPTGRQKLAGTSLGHFGGFLDERWRRNDLLWGRLDGAERLTTTLCHPDAAEGFRVRAQAAILREEYKASEMLMDLIDPSKRVAFVDLLAGEDDETLVAGFSASYSGPGELDLAAQLPIAGRAITVTGKVLESVERAQQALKKPAVWIARFGRFVWGFAELIVPPGKGTPWTGHVARHVPQIAVLLGALLIGLGLLSGLAGLRPAGWGLVGAGILLAIARGVVSDLSRLKLMLLLLLAALVALALAEAIFHGADDWRYVRDHTFL